MKERAPIFFFAPFVSSRTEISPSWIDYNGHLNVAQFHALFHRCVSEAFALLGLGSNYAAARGNSMFVGETHVVHKRELKVGDPVRVTLQLLDSDEKRIHFYLELRHAEEGWIAATMELLTLHIDMGKRKVAPFPEDILGHIAVMKAAHARLPRPEAVGRVISLSPHARAEREAMTAGTRH